MVRFTVPEKAVRRTDIGGDCQRYLLLGPGLPDCERHLSRSGDCHAIQELNNYDKAIFVVLGSSFFISGAEIPTKAGVSQHGVEAAVRNMNASTIHGWLISHPCVQSPASRRYHMCSAGAMY